jgi:hypothetical protein
MSQEEKTPINEEMKESPAIPITNVETKIIVKQPKVKKPESEKKPRTEAQLKAIEKMKEALAKKRQEKAELKKNAEETERKQREEAVKKAEEEAKKITPNVEVQKVRGRKPGTKNPPKIPVPKQVIPEPVQQRQMSHTEYTIMRLREKGIHVPDNATPYMLKMILSRYRS